jgi:hypothetical protein
MPDLAHEGNYLVTWVTTIADKAEPTVTELGAGVDLEGRITPTGVTREPSTDKKDTSKLNSTFSTQSTGRRSFNLSVQYVREETDTGGLEAALVYKALGYLVIRDNIAASTAYAASQEVEVYPVQVDQPAKSPPAANEDQMITVGFSMRDEPALDAVVTT